MQNDLMRTTSQQIFLVFRNMFIVVQRDVEFLRSIALDIDIEMLIFLKKFCSYMQTRSLLGNESLFNEWTKNNAEQFNKIKELKAAEEISKKQSALMELKEQELAKKLSEVDGLRKTYEEAMLGVNARKTIDAQKRELNELAAQVESAVDIFSFDAAKAREIIANARATM